MKRIVIVLMCLFAIAPTLLAQDKNKEEVKIVLVKEENSDNYVYEGVVPVEGVTKEEMFKRAKQWILANLKTGDNNLQFDEEGLSIINDATIIIKPAAGFSWVISKGFTNFKVHMQFKDGRYKLRFDNVIVYLEHGVGYPTNTLSYSLIMKERDTKAKKHVIKETNTQMSNIILGLFNAVKNNSNKDEW